MTDNNKTILQQSVNGASRMDVNSSERARELDSPMRRPAPDVGGSRYGPPPTGLNRSRDDVQQNMRVMKRNGQLEPVMYGKIQRRLERLSKGLHVNSGSLVQEVNSGLHDGIQASEIDRLSASLAHEKITDHPDYDVLAARIAVSNHHKETMAPFSEVMEALYAPRRLSDGTTRRGQLSDKFIESVRKNATRLNKAIDYDRDYLLTYFGFRTFEHSYGLRVTEFNAKTETEEERVYERPQHMWMRVAVALWLDDMDAAIETYEWMSCKYFTHASPTLFQAGTRRQQCSSCFLIAMQEDQEDDHPDSIEGIYDTLKQCARISKSAGGIGLHISSVRGTGSPITSAGRKSTGIIPMLKPFEQTALYVNQGGKRKGAFACFCKDTEVMTVNAGVKAIQDVQIGDLVVTHKNRVKPVSQVHKNPLGDRKIFKLVVERNKEIFVTGNHRFWSYHTKKYKDNKIGLGWTSVEQMKQLMDNPQTTRQSCYIAIPEKTGIQHSTDAPNAPNVGVIDVKDFEKSLCTGLNSLQETEDSRIFRITRTVLANGKTDISHTSSVKRFWPLTYDFVNFIGIWLGDGHIKKISDIIRGIGITVDKRNEEEISFIKQVCIETFGCHVSELVSKRSNCVNLVINSSLIGAIFHELFGSYFNGKCLPSMVFSWPKKMVESLLAGLITSDGHITKTKCNATIGMSNYKLMSQIYHLCRANGIAASFVEGKQGKGMTCVPYVMSVPLSENILSGTRKRYDDDRLERCQQMISCDKKMSKTFLKVLGVVDTDRQDEFVYTLGVEDDHSYTVEGLLCENCYAEPWHIDIEDFVRIKLPTGDESRRMRDLHIALFVNDLFMKRVQNDEKWSLMCPFYSPELPELYGEAFEKKYLEYEAMGAPYVRKTIRARDLWTIIVDSQIHTGEPYMVYKDASNKRTNHQNLGTIRSSNLCVAPYTRILTRDGYRCIGELKDQSVGIWNGAEWSEVTIRQTGSDRSLIRVTFSNGSHIDCTREHGFYLTTVECACKGRPFCENAKRKTAGELCLGDQTIYYHLPEDDTSDPKQLRTHFVTGIQEIEGQHDTYCAKEPLRGTLVFEDILTSNCSEILEYSDSSKTAVCNLSSVALPSFVVVEEGKPPRFDHDTLCYVVKMITRNLDRLIDINYYPTTETRTSNMSERPMGIGVQGLADCFIKMRYPFDSPEAMKLNREIFETMYYAALDASCELAEDVGEPYPSYHLNGGCPVANGMLQFDMWEADGFPVQFATRRNGTPRWNWNALRRRIAQHGVRNSLCLALMPTASTSQLLGNYESFEAVTSNMYARNVLSGTYKVVNRQMILDLIEEGLWDEQMKAKILYYGGSIQDITEIPEHIRALYKTSYDLSQKVIIDQSADRAPFIDQTQSLNLHLAEPSLGSVTSMHMYAWQRGLKTGQYYLRTKPAKRALQVTVAPELEAQLAKQQRDHEKKDDDEDDNDESGADSNSNSNSNTEGWVCTREEGCTSCSG